ncbi:MAG: hypothetical protein RSB25_16735 [Acinetobacter sp.]
MAMKQTQTKMFEFSDTGLDFCSGSKNLFPDRFKKMLALGFNEKTVTGVVVAGNQVTFSYEFAHGYVANRVLKVNSGPLATLHGGEFWIDSVTANTVTMTIEGAPLSIASGFVTKIASLGWELVYELNHVHIYKFKHIDDTDMYARLCFQNATISGYRNCIAVGIGRQVDLSLGTVLDAPFDLGSCATTSASTDNLKWDFTYDTARAYDNSTYTQGLTRFGKAAIVGSQYHIFIAGNAYTDNRFSYIYGIFPFVSTLNNLNYPALLCCFNSSSTGSMGTNQHDYQRIYVYNVDCLTSSIATYTFPVNFASQSFYPSSIEPFNTTGCFPIQLFTKNEKQPLGFIAGGLYQAAYASADKPPYDISQSPSISMDIDFSNPVVVHGTSLNINNPVSWLCSPVEEIKIGA